MIEQKITEMMICPNKQCPERESCTESKQHIHTKWCDVSGYYGQKTDVLCPKCVDITCKACEGKGYVIPYIPEQPKKPATCPECGHPVSEHKEKIHCLNCCRFQSNKCIDLTAIQTALESHDQQVRKEFAEQVIERWLWPSWDAFAAEVRAMAEGER